MTDNNTVLSDSAETSLGARGDTETLPEVPAPRLDPNRLRSAPADDKPNMLFIDIETAPAIAWVWGLFKQFIGWEQVIKPSRIICYSAQWYGQKQTMFQSEYEHTRMGMLGGLHQLFDEADIVVHYNGKRFDTPWIIGELITEKFQPPSPFKQIDLFQAVKGNMRNLSNKLDAVSWKLLGERKTHHTGFALWADCLIEIPADATEAEVKELTRRRDKAWRLMKRYNIQDTKLMIPLYKVLLPFIKQHPNVNPFAGTDGCPACGSLVYQKRGFSYVGVSKYQRYQCTDCGAWFKDGHALERTTFRPAT